MRELYKRQEGLFATKGQVLRHRMSAAQQLPTFLSVDPLRHHPGGVTMRKQPVAPMMTILDFLQRG